MLSVVDLRGVVSGGWFRVGGGVWLLAWCGGWSWPVRGVRVPWALVVVSLAGVGAPAGEWGVLPGEVRGRPGSGGGEGLVAAPWRPWRDGRR